MRLALHRIIFCVLFLVALVVADGFPQGQFNTSIAEQTLYGAGGGIVLPVLIFVGGISSGDEDTPCDEDCVVISSFFAIASQPIGQTIGLNVPMKDEDARNISYSGMIVGELFGYMATAAGIHWYSTYDKHHNGMEITAGIIGVILTPAFFGAVGSRLPYWTDGRPHHFAMGLYMPKASQPGLALSYQF